MRTSWLTSATLRECAFERLDQALVLLDSNLSDASPLAAYASGVAAECAIRAKRKVVSDELNARHRLIELATEADYASRLSGESRARFAADLNRLDGLWDNLLRYCSTGAYLEYLDRRAVRLGTEYGRLKSSDLASRVGDVETARLFAEETYVAAARIVRYGEQFWRKR